MMDLTPRETALLDTYLAPFLDLAGDQRTRCLLAGTVAGIIGSERLTCSRIAAFSPSTRRHPARGETDPADVTR